MGLSISFIPHFFYQNHVEPSSVFEKELLIEPQRLVPKGAGYLRILGEPQSYTSTLLTIEYLPGSLKAYIGIHPF